MAQPKKKKTDKLLNIVAIGASAGGLGALKKLFSLIPEDSGLAFVVVVHLSPDHESVLAELLQPSIDIPVLQVTKTLPLQANHIYVIPPNANLNTIDTHLRLSELEKKRVDRAPIDHFFQTLAETHDGESIGVILTGTGSDGTLGIRAIRERGGVTIVQDPDEAEYDGMPRSAISTGLIDKVLPLQDIPKYLLELTQTQPKLKTLQSGIETSDKERKLIQKLFAMVRTRTNRDFTRYKLTTITRRLQRRMQIQQTAELENYLELVSDDSAELKALSDEFLINVTSFFRDPKVYEYLASEVIPKIFERREPEEQIRLWSVGCATGEEAYSLAMLLVEEANRRDIAPDIQIFASDLHEPSLAKGREGFYPSEIRGDVSDQRLNRFFIKEEGGYRIRKEIRDLIIFTAHNLLSDPPFSRMDMIVCRNLLIYLKREVQRDVFELFHYSLPSEGYLVLGTSEHMESNELYRTVDKESSVYLRRNVPGPEPRLPVFPKIKRHFEEQPSQEKESKPASYDSLHQQTLERYAPPSMLLSAEYQVLHLSQNAGRYLSITGGQITNDAFSLVRPEIRMELRSAIYAANERNTMIRSRPVKIKLDGTERKVVLSVRAQEEPESDYAFLVLFEEFEYDPNDETQVGSGSGMQSSETNRTKELEHELDQNRERLQAIIEEYETSREEMKASNEELQSANEELRSTMEELETSKEELQSMNEELTTLNQENRHKVDELGQLNDDLQNLLSATDIATLFLDRELCILRFTNKLGELFNVRAADRGRPISDQTNQLGYSNLEADAEKVLKNLTLIEKEVQDQQGNYYQVRILPYRSSDDRIEGVVITFMDITKSKKAEEKLQASQEKLKLALEAARMGIWEYDPKTKQIETTFRHDQLFGYDKKLPKWSLDAARRHIIAEDRSKFDEAIQTALQTGSLDVEFRVKWQDGSLHWMHDRGSTTFDQKGKAVRLSGVMVETTEKKLVSEDHRKSDAFYHLIFEKQSVGFCLMKPVYRKDGSISDFSVLESNQSFARYTGIQPSAGKAYSQLEKAPKNWVDIFRRALKTDQLQKEIVEIETGSRKLKLEVVPLKVEGAWQLALLFDPEESDAKG